MTLPDHVAKVRKKLMDEYGSDAYAPHEEDEARDGKHGFRHGFAAAWELAQKGPGWAPLRDAGEEIHSLRRENAALRKGLNDIQYDFNPDDGELGPKCGYDILEQIKDAIQRADAIREGKE